VLTLRSVATRDELEALSSEELHDRATRHALRHANVRFFWRLLQSLPAAEASVGEMDEAHDDVQSLYGRLNDLRHSGEGEVADALSPLYIEYLEKHG
jgi:hypothetical protein